MRFLDAALYLAPFCALWAPSAPLGAQTYEAEILEAFNAGSTAYPQCTTHALTGTGAVIGNSTDASSTIGFVWTPAGGMARRYPATDCNAGLLAVHGDRLLDLNANVELQVIPPPTTGNPLASTRAINNLGVAVGSARRAVSNPQPHDYVAFYFDVPTGSHALPVQDARDAVRINDSNVIIGHIVRPNSTVRQAYVHDLIRGTTIVLSQRMPSMPRQNYTPSEVFDINANGHVVGEGYSGTAMQGFVWTAANGFTWLPALDGGDIQSVHPRGVSADGTVVGYARNANNDWRAFRFDPVHGMVDLNTLCDIPAGLVFDRALRIGADGWIVGSGSGPGWTPPKGVILRPHVCQPDLGFAGPGGTRLAVCGLPLATAGHADVRITGAPSNALAVLAVGLQPGNLSIFAGTLVPHPTLFTVGLVTDAQGGVLLPEAIAGGGGPLSIYAQVATMDPTTPAGVGLSNAVRIDLLP